jgi:hypothetical protein
VLKSLQAFVQPTLPSTYLSSLSLISGLFSLISTKPSAMPVPTSARNGVTHAKRTRAVRRRGRAKLDVESDDEIEREDRTDSESEDDISISDSSSDSDTEPASEDVLTSDQPRVLTPSTSNNPGGDLHVVVNGHNDPFFGTTGNWSDLVEEAANAPQDLPVIDFTELNSQVLPSRKPKKNQKHNRRASASSPVQPEEKVDSPVQRPVSRRPSGQSARQAYQQRLEADPSYVPTVGEFWGHDDRLLDKDLRSLSGWWRGRWQGAFRGRGSFSRGAVRGRGGFIGQPVPRPSASEKDTAPAQPVDQAWTHDGFEEMRSKEVPSGPSQRQVEPHAPVRGRGGLFVGRGGRGGRGTFSPSFRARPADPDRVWFTKKPEHMWTKQAESFLYYDSSTKPRRGNESAIVRVKLPNQKTPAVRVVLKSTQNSLASKSPAASTSDPESDNTVVVRMPKPVHTERAEVMETALPLDEPSIEDVFTVRPRLVSPKLIPLPEHPVNTKSSVSHTVSSSVSSVDPAIQQKLEQVSVEPHKSDPARWLQTEEAVLRNPTRIALGEHQQTVGEEQPSLPPVQHNFSSQGSSPAYGSPYQFAPPLPPGVAVNPAGMTYEVATGRPVYLPPPSNMYNPPMMQPAPFIPGHAHHRSSVSPSDFIPSGTSPINGYMEYTPTPLFPFPRQSSRIEIRAPDGSVRFPAGPSEKQPSPVTAATSATTKPSGLTLRSDADAFTPLSAQQHYFAPLGSLEAATEADVSSSDPQQVQEPMMSYIPYNPYYYPEPYGYNPYVDLSQVPYEMYPPPQGTAYYH